MAKTSGPLFSLGASGKFGGAAVYSIWKGITYVRQLVTPANPKSAAQGAQRLVIASAGKVNKVLDIAGTLATFLRTVTPNGQSYASYFAQQMLLHIDQSTTDYNTGGNAAIKAFFDNGAEDAAIESAVVSYAADTPIEPGLSLWNAYQTAFVLGSPSAAGTALTADQAEVDAFVVAML